MRNLLLSFVLLALGGLGCQHQRSTPVFQPVPGMSETTIASQPATPAPAPAPEPTPAPQPPEKTIITPDTGLTGKVASYNDAGRFVVVDLPVGRMPAVGQRLFVYRGGLKVGELKVSEWNRDHYVVADVVTGNAQKDDEVRDN